MLPFGAAARTHLRVIVDRSTPLPHWFECGIDVQVEEIGSLQFPGRIATVNSPACKQEVAIRLAHDVTLQSANVLKARIVSGDLDPPLRLAELGTLIRPEGKWSMLPEYSKLILRVHDGGLFTTEVPKMDTREIPDLKKETNHWASYLLASIADGNFRDGVSRMVQHYHDRMRPRTAEEERLPGHPAPAESLTGDGPLTLSIPEAARILRISRPTAYSLANQGKLPVVRLGRRLIVPRKRLNELLSGGPLA